MRYNKTNLITLITFLILITSLTFSPKSGNAQQASTTLQDGDRFVFDTWFQSDFSDGRNFEIWNASDPTQSLRIEEEFRYENMLGSGLTTATFGRINEAGYDTAMILDQQLSTLPGSERGGYRYLYDEGQGGFVFNETFPTDDLSGIPFNKRDSQRFISNSTYAVIMDEWFQDFTEARIQPFIWTENTTYNSMAPLENISVSLDTYDYLINGNPQTLNVRIVDLLYSMNYTETGVWWMPFGDPNDPNRVDQLFQFTQTITYYEYNTYIFDASNGILLEILEESYGSYWIDLWKDNFEITPGSPPAAGLGLDQLPPPQPMNVSAASSMYFDFGGYTSVIVTEASSFYGGQRPVSTGTNRLMEGDVLNYDFKQNTNAENEFTVSGTDGQFSFEERKSETYNSDVVGTGTIKVWNHNPDSISALIYLNGFQTDQNDWSSERKENGVVMYSNTGSDFFNLDYFEMDDLFSMTSSQYEIAPEIDQSMFLPPPDDKNEDCRDQCDGGFPVQLPNELKLTTQYNSTYITANALNINGFDYILEIEMIVAEYEAHLQEPIMIPMGDGGGEGPPPMINVNLNFDALGIRKYFYDVDTGVLVGLEETIQVNVTMKTPNILQTAGLSLNQSPPPMEITLDAKSTITSVFSLWIETHPREYLTAQTSIPTSSITEVPSNTTTSTNTTTTDSVTNTSDSVSSSDSISTTPDLPVPIPTYTIYIGIIVGVVIKRKKR